MADSSFADLIPAKKQPDAGAFSDLIPETPAEKAASPAMPKAPRFSGSKEYQSLRDSIYRQRLRELRNPIRRDGPGPIGFDTPEYASPEEEAAAIADYMAPIEFEKQQFEASRTPLTRWGSSQIFGTSLPVRVLTQGEYGIGDLVSKIPYAEPVGKALSQAETGFVRANRDELETLAALGESAMAIPPLAELGAVPGMALKSAGAGVRQGGNLLREMALPTTKTGSGAAKELAASVTEGVTGAPYMATARNNALPPKPASSFDAFQPETTFSTRRTIPQKIVGGVKDVKEAVTERIPGLRSGRDARLYRMLERQGQTPEQAIAYLETGQEAAKFGRGSAALPETIADIGPASRRMTRTLEAMPGEAATRTEQFLEMRQRGTPTGMPKKQAIAGQYERVTDDLKRSLKVTRDDFAKTKEALIRQQKEASGPAYEAFRNLKDAKGDPLLIDVGPVLRASEEADSSLSPTMKRLMQKARSEFMDEIIARDMSPGLNQEVRLGKSAIAASAPTARLTPARFQSGKEAIDDMIATAQGRGLSNQVRLLSELKNKLVEVADKASTRPATQKQTMKFFDETGKGYDQTIETPVAGNKGRPAMESVYAKARDAYSSPAELQDALSKGRTFMKGDSEVTAAQYKALSSAEQRMFRIGMAKQAMVDLGKKTRGSDMVRYFDRPNVESVLSEIMTPKQYGKFLELMKREGRMLATRRSTQNSVTAKLQEDVEDFTWMGKVIKSLKDKGVVGATMDFAGDIIGGLTRMREKSALEMAEALFETDPVRQREILQEVARKYGRARTRAAYQGVAQQAQQAAMQAQQAGQAELADAMNDLARRAYSAAPRYLAPQNTSPGAPEPLAAQPATGR